MPQLSVNEVARLKGVSVRTVYRAVSEARLPAERVGRAVLIPSNAADSWSPMVTKARPQVRADEQLRSTLEAITGLGRLGGGRHLGLAMPDPAIYRAYLARLVREAAAQGASLAVFTDSVSADEAREMGAKEVGAAAVGDMQFGDSGVFFGETTSFDPVRQAQRVRDLVEGSLTKGAGQALYSAEIPAARERFADARGRAAWAAFEAGVTRTMRHVPGLAISVLSGEQGVETLAAFASCYPQCVVGNRPGFLVHATALSVA